MELLGLYVCRERRWAMSDNPFKFTKGDKVVSRHNYQVTGRVTGQASFSSVWFQEDFTGKLSEVQESELNLRAE